METARLGFVGCGSHSTNNIYPMLAYARCRLVAVCDADERLAQRNARIYGADAVYTDVAAMLDECELDGVLVVGPLQMHYAVGIEVLKRGISLFVEKPPAPNLQLAEEMVALARANDTFLMPGFMKRHGLAYRKVKALIESGEFVPAVGHFKYAHWQANDLEGMLSAMSIHIVDLALSFFGAPVSATSALFRDARGALSMAVTLRFADERWVQLTLDSSQPRIQERVEISGTMDGESALVVVDNVQHLELHRQHHHGIDLLASGGRTAEMHEIAPEFDLRDISLWRPDFAIPNMAQTRGFFQGFAGEVREFADAIIEGREPNPGTADALQAMRVTDALGRNPNGTTHFESTVSPNTK